MFTGFADETVMANGISVRMRGYANLGHDHAGARHVGG